MLHDVDNVWFQQNVAPAHTYRRAMEILKEMLPGQRSLINLIAW